MLQVIDSKSARKDLLSEMVRFQSALGVSAVGWVDAFVELLIDLPTAWYLVSASLKNEYAESWSRIYGEWNHAGGNTKLHNRLGMAYAWWVLHEVNGLEEIHLSDSPDFTGRMALINSNHTSPKSVRVFGDIGKCTPVALDEALKSMNFHDVWISVLDWDTQVLINFGYSPAQYGLFKIATQLWGVRDYQRTMKDIFFCEDCNMWSITEESRQQLIEWSQSKR